MTSADHLKALVRVVCVVVALPVQAAPPAHGGHEGHGGWQSKAAAPWTDLPLIEATPGRDRSKAGFRLANLQADSVEAFAPGRQAPWPEGVRFKTDKVAWSLPVEGGRVVLESAGVGNYHWLQATETTPQGVKVASTAHYFSNPGPAPTAMLARRKSDLEIIPSPLPREHNRYRTHQEWTFQVRFQGEPLPGAQVSFASSGGTRGLYTSDGRGFVRVVFPDDLLPAPGGGHGMGPSNRFLLAVEQDHQNRHYLTTFSYAYGEDAYAQRSLVLGGGFLALGGLLGLPLILRRKETNHG